MEVKQVKYREISNVENDVTFIKFQFVMVVTSYRCSCV
jgi:hypothetical protein